jgi:hypothetical protein
MFTQVMKCEFCWSHTLTKDVCGCFCCHLVPPINSAVKWKAHITGLLLMALAIVLSVDFLWPILVAQELGNWAATTSRAPYVWKAHIGRGAARCPDGIVCDIATITSQWMPCSLRQYCLTPWLQWNIAFLGRNPLCDEDAWGWILEV